MAVEEEYELLPHEEIQRLRKELDRLKKNPLGDTPAAKDLHSAVSDLTEAVNNLTKMLTQTNEDMVKEFEKTSISEQFSQISDQNEQIAQGILSVAQLVQKSQASPSPVSPPIQPQAPIMNNQGIAPQAPPLVQQEPIPPMPTMANSVSSQEPLSPAPAMPNPIPSQEPMPPMGAQSLNPEPIGIAQAPPMSQPSLMSTPNSIPPPALDLPPAPAKKKGIMGLFK